MTSRLVILLAFALTAPALAGCIGSKDEPVKPGSNTGTTGGDVTYPPALVRTALATAVGASADWVKPGDAVTLTADAPSGASGDVTYEWSYGPLPGKPAAAAADDHSAHGGEAPSEDARGDASLDTGMLASNAYSDPMKFEAEGTYLFHCHPHPTMKLTITVREGANASSLAHVAIIDDAETGQPLWRFAPQEIEVAPGTSIVFWNNSTVEHTATQEGFEPLTTPIVGASGPSITWTPDKDGDYRVVVVVRDAANGYGKTETRVLVDSGRPDPVKAFDAKTGSFNAAAAGQSDAAANPLGFVLDYETTKFTVKWTATSAAPAPEPQVQVTITTQAGEPVASADAAATGELVAENLAAGQYKVVVTPQQGLAVEYSIEVTAEYKLKAPAPGEGGGGGHAH